MPISLRSLLGLLLVGGSSLAAQDRRAVVLDSIFAQPSTGPGCAVGVLHNGEVTLRRSYGMADLEHQVPITSSAVFYTGSLSKQVTAMAVAMLAQDGVIDLDAPASKWIPEMTGPLAVITVRQMVHHTSGLREKWDLLAMQGVPTDRTVVTQQMVLDLVAKQRELNFTPGSRYLYNNTAYDLLATLVGRASGVSFREFVQQRIFAPRGMTRSVFLDRWNAILPDRAEGYAWEGYPQAYMVRSPALVETVGSGSLHSTLDDMLRWVAWFDTAPARDSALINLLETPGNLNSGERLRYAFGLVVDEWEGRRRIQHTGSLAGYRTVVWRLPEEEWSAVILCNAGWKSPARDMEAMAQLFFGMEVNPTLSTMSTLAPGIFEGNAIPDDLPGRYTSDELGVTWVITNQGEFMGITGPGIQDDRLTLSLEAMLVDGRWEVRVVRNSAGAISSLLVDTSRSIGVRFTRAPE